MKIKDLIPRRSGADLPQPAQGEEQTNPIATLQREMNQLLDGFWKRMGRGFGEVDWPWGHAEARSDVVQTDKGIEVSIELPGMSLEDIDVSVANDTLMVKGEKKVERKEEKKGYYLSERSYGAIWRSIPLPPGVDGDKAQASFRNGVLTIRLPQAADAEAKVKRIAVKAD